MGDQCDYLVQWYAGWLNTSTRCFSAIVEHMDFGSLAGALEKNNFQPVEYCVIPTIVRRILLGLRFLHQRDLAHASLQPENVLLKRCGELKLADYCLTPANESMGMAVVVVPRYLCYLSPESCIGMEKALDDDIWALGMIAIELALGTHPFADAVTNFAILFDCICEAPLPCLDPVAHPELSDLVSRCLVRKDEAALGFDSSAPSPPDLGIAGAIASAVADTAGAKQAHVVVQTLVGNRIFGPAALETRLRCRDLLRLLQSESGSTQRADIILNGHVLPPVEHICGGTEEDPLVLILVLHLERASSQELLQHPYCTSNIAESPQELVQWFDKIVSQAQTHAAAF